MRQEVAGEPRYRKSVPANGHQNISGTPHRRLFNTRDAGRARRHCRFPVWCADRAPSPETHSRYYLSSALSRYWHALRTATLIVCLLDAEVWALVAFAMLNLRSDAPTKGPDEATGYIVTVLFLITAVTAVALILIPSGAKNDTDTRICFSGSICGPVHHGHYGFYRGAACCAVTPRPRRITSGLAPLHPALN